LATGFLDAFPDDLQIMMKDTVPTRGILCDHSEGGGGYGDPRQRNQVLVDTDLA
jgi:hypothetical protein